MKKDLRNRKSQAPPGHTRIACQAQAPNEPIVTYSGLKLYFQHALQQSIAPCEVWMLDVVHRRPASCPTMPRHGQCDAAILRTGPVTHAPEPQPWLS